MLTFVETNPDNVKRLAALFGQPLEIMMSLMPQISRQADLCHADFLRLAGVNHQAHRINLGRLYA